MSRINHKKIDLIVVFTVVFLFMLSGCTFSTITIFSDESNTPQRCFEEFMDCLVSERYNEADQYILNYETLGFESVPDDPFTLRIYKDICGSRSGRVVSVRAAEGHKATLLVEYTTLSVKLIEPELSTLTSEFVYEQQYAGEDYSNEERYEEAMQICLEELLADPTRFYKTNTFSLDFEFDDGKWKMICTDDFYSALIGYSI